MKHVMARDESPLEEALIQVTLSTQLVFVLPSM
jgi:hypothetical protein